MRCLLPSDGYSAYTDRVFAAVLSFSEMKREGDSEKAIKTIRSRIMNLQDFDWKKLVAIIANIELR